MTRLVQVTEAIRGSATPPPSDHPSYRCPGCGEAVDGTDRNAVSRHHLHILHPHLFRFGSKINRNGVSDLAGNEELN